MAICLNVSNLPDLQSLLDDLGLHLPPAQFTPHYNVRPHSAVWGVTRTNQGALLSPMQWGFIPPWAKDGQFRRPLTIARAETLHEKPSFRHLITRYRGLLPINGFYEWQRTPCGRNAYYVTGNGRGMALATICQMHGDGYQQCCVITRKSRGAMAEIHEREPITLPSDKLSDWLFDDRPALVSRLLDSQTKLSIKALANYVDDPANDGPECLTPVRQSGSS